MKKYVEIKCWDNNVIIHSGQFESVKECLEDGVKKDISFAYADLSNAYFSYANLSNTDLSNTDLSNTVLFNIKGKNILIIGGIGSSKRNTYYVIEDDYVNYGSFKGTLRQFINEIRKTYTKDNIYRKQYINVVKYIKAQNGVVNV